MTVFPSQIPDLPFSGHGWLRDENRVVLAKLLGPDTKVIVEIGTWLGLSARFMCDCAPNAVVYAVDHWKGLPEPEWRRLAPDPWAQFVRDCWNYRHQIVPVRTDSWSGIQGLAQWFKAIDTVPDLVYLDGSHDYTMVLGDIQLIQQHWPDTLLVGDDWDWPGVRRAVQEVYNGTQWPNVEGNCWWVPKAKP